MSSGTVHYAGWREGRRLHLVGTYDYDHADDYKAIIPGSTQIYLSDGRSVTVDSAPGFPKWGGYIDLASDPGTSGRYESTFAERIPKDGRFGITVSDAKRTVRVFSAKKGGNVEISHITQDDAAEKLRKKPGTIETAGDMAEAVFHHTASDALDYAGKGGSTLYDDAFKLAAIALVANAVSKRL
jgi:hypothetical protein